MRFIRNRHFATILLCHLALAGQAAAQVCVEPPAGLLAWWPGDGDGSNLEGDSQAKLMNGAGFMPGLVDGAFGLNGVDEGQDDRVVLSRMAADGLADLTIEFWVQSTDARGAIVSGANGHDRGANEFLMIQRESGLVVWLKQASSGVIPVFLNDGVWHHVAFVRQGDTGRLFVDGALVDSRLYPEGPLDIGPHGLLLGQDQDCLAGCFEIDQALDGSVDELAVYGRALPETDVLALFDADLAGKCKPPVEDNGDVFFADRMESLEFEVDVMIDRIVDLEGQIEELKTMPPGFQMGGGHIDKKSRWHHREDHDDDKHRRRGKKYRKR